MRFALCGLGLLVPDMALAQALTPEVSVSLPPATFKTEGYCVYNGKIFSNGATICVGKGYLQLCSVGKWNPPASQIGDALCGEFKPESIK
jgi:hypothetical protein